MPREFVVIEQLRLFEQNKKPQLPNVNVPISKIANKPNTNTLFAFFIKSLHVCDPLPLPS